MSSIGKASICGFRKTSSLGDSTWRVHSHMDILWKQLMMFNQRTNLAKRFLELVDYALENVRVLCFLEFAGIYKGTGITLRVLVGRAPLAPRLAVLVWVIPWRLGQCGCFAKDLVCSSNCTSVAFQLTWKFVRVYVAPLLGRSTRRSSGISWARAARRRPSPRAASPSSISTRSARSYP